jgi:hypothetical protein
MLQDQTVLPIWHANGPNHSQGKSADIHSLFEFGDKVSKQNNCKCSTCPLSGLLNAVVPNCIIGSAMHIMCTQYLERRHCMQYDRCPNQTNSPFHIERSDLCAAQTPSPLPPLFGSPTPQKSTVGALPVLNHLKSALFVVGCLPFDSRPTHEPPQTSMPPFPSAVTASRWAILATVSSCRADGHREDGAKPVRCCHYVSHTLTLCLRLCLERTAPCTQRHQLNCRCGHYRCDIMLQTSGCTRLGPNRCLCAGVGQPGVWMSVWSSSRHPLRHCLPATTTLSTHLTTALTAYSSGVSLVQSLTNKQDSLVLDL